MKEVKPLELDRNEIALRLLAGMANRVMVAEYSHRDYLGVEMVREAFFLADAFIREASKK